MSDKAYGIVVGVDFSPLGDVALAQALRLSAGRASPELHVVHVVTRADEAAGDGVTRLERLDDALQELPTRLWNRVDDVMDEVAGGLPQMRVWIHVRVGDTGEAIHQVAVDYDADIIVVGTHGRKGLEKLVLGSVADHLFRKARCPVLVVRPKAFEGLEKTPRVEEAGPVTGGGERPKSHLHVERRTMPPSLPAGGLV